MWYDKDLGSPHLNVHSVKGWQLLGAVIIWILVLLSPPLGKGIVDIITPRSDPYSTVAQPLALYHIWDGLWQTIGYKIDNTFFVQCDTNTSGTLFYYLSLLSGLLVGGIGGAFQGFLIKIRWGFVKISTIIGIAVVWGTILGILSLGFVNMLWIDSNGGCRTSLVDPITAVLNLLSLVVIMSVVLIPAILFAGFDYTNKQWHFEEKRYEEWRKFQPK
jgi:hypothetical protein